MIDTRAFKVARSPPDRVASHARAQPSSSTATGSSVSFAVVPATSKSDGSRLPLGCRWRIGAVKAIRQVSVSALVRSTFGE